MSDLIYTVFSTPLGLAGIAATKKGVCRVKIGFKKETDFTRPLETAYKTPPQKNPKALRDIQNQLKLYLSGKSKPFDCPLDLSLGTPFQQKVWRKLLTIPHGSTRSYQWLAQAVKNPHANRAVGNANGKNPVSIIVPCHRVVRKNGGLGGYTEGTHIKQSLLDTERNKHAAV